MKVICPSVKASGGFQTKTRHGWFANLLSGCGGKLPAFTLIELLVVISIMGLIASLAVPALKNLGKSNIQTSASRQLLDDIGRARQLAISQHTTVYMVFVTTNFFAVPCTYNSSSYGSLINGINAMTSAGDRLQALNMVTNLVDKQLTGYNFVSYGKVGDQPGQHSWHYLSTWQALPQGTFVAAAKFQSQNNYLTLPQWQQDYASQIDAWVPSGTGVLPQINGFATTAGLFSPIPFPTEQSPLVALPFIAFDHTGRLVSETRDNINFHHAYIPLAQGSVTYGYDQNKQPTLNTVGAGDITETPPNNSTNISYNVIDVDPLTGRAKLEYYHLP